MTRYFYNPVSAARLTPERTRVGVLSQGICCEALQTSTFEELLLASMAVPKPALRGETTFWASRRRFADGSCEPAWYVQRAHNANRDVFRS